MKNFDSSPARTRYMTLHNGDLLLQGDNMDRLNERLPSWIGEAERTRILEEAWESADIYDEIDPKHEEEGTEFWEGLVNRRSHKILSVLKLEGIRAKTGRLARECAECAREVRATVEDVRDVVRRHASVFAVAAGLATGAISTCAVSNLESFEPIKPITYAFAAPAPDAETSSASCDTQ